MRRSHSLLASPTLGQRPSSIEVKAKDVDVIAVVAANDPFVMSGWARVEGVKDKVRDISRIHCRIWGVYACVA